MVRAVRAFLKEGLSSHIHLRLGSCVPVVRQISVLQLLFRCILRLEPIGWDLVRLLNSHIILRLHEEGVSSVLLAE